MEESFFSQLLQKGPFGFDFDIWGIIKGGVLFGLFLYMGFAIMLVRQVDLMSRALNGSFDKSLKILSWSYLFLTIAVFLLAMVFL